MDCEEEASPAYRIAMAARIPCTILNVEKEFPFPGGERVRVTYLSDFKDAKEEECRVPLYIDSRFGNATRWLWDRWGEDGSNYWVGKKAYVYKHNEPPREGDRNSHGYRMIVFAEERN